MKIKARSSVGHSNSSGRARMWGLGGLAAFMVAGAPAAHGQGCDQWSGFGDGVNGAVNAVAVFEGELVIGGAFAGDSRIARWDGAAWQTIGGGFQGSVEALAVYNGDLIAGGWFNDSQGHPNRVARWDGAAWQPLLNGVSDNTVFALAVYNNELIVAGNFTSAGGVSVNRIARWNGSSWQRLGTSSANGVTGPGTPQVRALLAHDGTLIIGGAFDGAGGGAAGSANRIATWDGTAWGTLGSGIGNNTVRSLAVFQGDLHAGGSFSTTIPQPDHPRDLARWNGTVWEEVSPVRPGSGVWALLVYDGKLVLGGQFTAAGARIATWDGSQWGMLPPGFNVGAVNSLSVYSGQLIAGGSYTALAGDPAGTTSRIAAWGCVTARCCLPDGSCEMLNEVACDSAAGVFGGIGSECAGFTCPPAPPTCYANCDGSTTPPILNVEDFTCFINEFASATMLPPAQQEAHYANCDGSSTPPVLNVEDFTCFINRFAIGCP